MGMREIRNLVESMVRPLKNRLYATITRGIIEAVNDSDGMQVVKVNLLAGEARDEIERFQNFGFSSNPPTDSECVAVAIGGNRDHLIIIVADDRASRPTGIAKGESVQYNKNGDKMHLKNEGTLEGTLSKNFELTLKKLKFENDNGELVDLLIQMATALAAEPFILNKATFSDIATKLTTFKVF